MAAIERQGEGIFLAGVGVPEKGEVDAMKVDPLESGSLDGSHFGDSVHDHRSAQDIG